MSGTLLMLSGISAFAQTTSYHRSTPTPTNPTGAALHACTLQLSKLAANGTDEKIPADSAALVARLYHDSLVAAQLGAETRRQATQCLATLDLRQVPDTQLNELADLQSLARDGNGLRATLFRIANDKSMPLAKRYDQMRWHAENLVTMADTAAPSIARILVAMADSLGNVEQQLADRIILARAVRAVDSLQAYSYANEAYMFAKSLDSTSRGLVGRDMASLVSYVNDWAAQDSYVRRGVGFTALVTNVFGQDSSYLQSLTDAYGVASFLGAHAVPIEAPRWINAPPGTKRMRFDDGKVTLVEFTAHWCHGCKFSYGPLARIYKRLEPQGFRAMFATRVYGYVGRKFRLTPEQEAVADSDLFVGEYGIPFPIAIAAAPPRVPNPTDDDRKDVNSRRYHVDGLPHFILIDKHGIIRNIWLGWNEPVILGQIKQLLAEK